MIRLQEVTKVYEGGTVAVRDANLEVPKGEFVFLVGPSGSGKSTIIRLMLRQDDVTRGSIWVAIAEGGSISSGCQYSPSLTMVGSGKRPARESSRPCLARPTFATGAP